MATAALNPCKRPPGPLGVGWGSQGSIAPFLSIETNGLLLDNGNKDINQRHHVKQGPLLIDRTAQKLAVILQPAAL